MKPLFPLTLFFVILFISCYSPTPPPAIVPVQQQPVVVQQDPTPTYEIRTDPYGQQIVYYTDPYLHTSYFLEYALFTSLLNSGGYGGIHNYYVSHRTYVDRNYVSYNRTYTRRSYVSTSDNGARFRSSMPNRPSTSTTTTTTRSSIPTGRPTTVTNTTTTSTRTSMPSGRAVPSAPSYRPSIPSSSSSSRSSFPSSSSSSRSSMPSGRRR